MTKKEKKSKEENTLDLPAKDIYVRNARVFRVIDGDTIEVQLDLGFEIWVETTLRFAGVDTPEVYGVKKDSDEYARGKEASAFTRLWLATNCVQETHPSPTAASVANTFPRVVIHSHKRDGKGKYGRWVVDVYSTDGSLHLNEALRTWLASKGW